MLPNSGYIYNYVNNYSGPYLQNVVQPGGVVPGPRFGNFSGVQNLQISSPQGVYGPQFGNLSVVPNPQFLPPGGVHPATGFTGLPASVPQYGHFSGAILQNVYNPTFLPPGAVPPAPGFSQISSLPGGIPYLGNYSGPHLQNVHNPHIFNGYPGASQSAFLTVNSTNVYMRQSQPPQILPRPNCNNVEKRLVEKTLFLPGENSVASVKKNVVKKNGRSFVPRKVDVHIFESQGLASEGYNFGSKNSKKTT